MRRFKHRVDAPVDLAKPTVRYHAARGADLCGRGVRWRREYALLLRRASSDHPLIDTNRTGSETAHVPIAQGRYRVGGTADQRPRGDREIPVAPSSVHRPRSPHMRLADWRPSTGNAVVLCRLTSAPSVGSARQGL